jgi:protein-disulfide isomerase
MDRRFLGILGAIIVVFIVIFAVSQNSGSNSTDTGNTKPTSHIEGQGKANVTLVEYGDYQCPVCYTYYQPLKQVFSQFSDQIHFQFRNLPLTSLHPNAFAAARAAEAAGLQGKYWQMHDQLYENQDPSGATGWVVSKDPLNSFFIKFASNIGLDITKFKQDYGSEQVNNSINADLKAFSQTGEAQATPAFFLNGKFIDNSQVVDNSGVSVEKFASLINAEIAKKAKSTDNQ